MRTVTPHGTDGPIIDLSDCVFDEPVVLRDREFQSIRFLRCVFRRGVDMSGIRCRGDVEFVLCHIHAAKRHRRGVAKALQLPRARIEGRLSLRGTALLNVEGAFEEEDGEERGEADRPFGDLHAPNLQVKGGIVASVWIHKPEEAPPGITDVEAQTPFPFAAHTVELSDAKIQGRVDFGGAKVSGAFRMPRARIQGTLALEWRPHSRDDHTMWFATSERKPVPRTGHPHDQTPHEAILIDEPRPNVTAENAYDHRRYAHRLRTVVCGRLDLDKIEITGSLMARGIWVGRETILNQGVIRGSVIFRAWHVSEREERNLDHARWASEAQTEEVWTFQAIPSELVGGFCGHHLTVGNLLNLTGSIVGPIRRNLDPAQRRAESGHEIGSTRPAIDLSTAHLGDLSIATWRNRAFKDATDTAERFTPEPYSRAFLPIVPEHHDPLHFHRRAIVKGSIRLVGATLDASLRMNGAEVKGMILAPGLRIGGVMDLSAFCVDSKFLDAAVANEPNGRDKRVHHDLPTQVGTSFLDLAGEVPDAIDAEHLSVKGPVILDGSEFYGGLRLERLHAERFSATCRRGRSTIVGMSRKGTDCWSLRLGFAEIGGSVTVAGAKFLGGLNLYGATVQGGFLAGPLQDGKRLVRTVIGPGRITINLFDRQTDGDGFSLNLANATIGGDVCLDAPALVLPMCAAGLETGGSILIRIVEPATGETIELESGADDLRRAFGALAKKSDFPLCLKEDVYLCWTDGAHLGDPNKWREFCLYQAKAVSRPDQNKIVESPDFSFLDDHRRIVFRGNSLDLAKARIGKDLELDGFDLYGSQRDRRQTIDLRDARVGTLKLRWSGTLTPPREDWNPFQYYPNQFLLNAWSAFDYRIELVRGARIRHHTIKLAIGVLLLWWLVRLLPGGVWSLLSVAFPIGLSAALIYSRARMLGRVYTHRAEKRRPAQRAESLRQAKGKGWKAWIVTFFSAEHEPEASPLRVSGFQFEDLDLETLGHRYAPRRMRRDDYWRSGFFDAMLTLFWLMLAYLIVPWRSAQLVALAGVVMAFVYAFYSIRHNAVRDLLSATEFDGGFYSRVERWLQSNGKGLEAGKVTRALQRRRMAAEKSSFIRYGLPHIFFGHGTRIWPALACYAALGLVGLHVFNDPKALEYQADLQVAQDTLRVQAAGLEASVGRPSATRARSAKTDFRNDTKQAAVAIAQSRLDGLERDREMERGSIGPTLRALVPFATFTLRDDFTFSNEPIRLSRGSISPWLAHMLVVPSEEGQRSPALPLIDGSAWSREQEEADARKDALATGGPAQSADIGKYSTFPADAAKGPQKTAPKWRPITYAELAAIMTLAGWLLLPIFLVKLVSQMRRLESKEFEP